jgi:phospholipase C
MNHEYTAKQKAFNGGLLDKFVEYTSSRDPGCTDIVHRKQVMGYYDGNTVTASWNYAQHFARNDNSFNTIFGPSTSAVFNLIA